MIPLDSCALLWLAGGSSRISEEVLRRIDAEPIVSVSAITVLEIGLKTGSGKLQLPMPPVHKDPVDRIIVATAKSMGATVVTGDAHFAAYGVEVIL
jgi:PIN domain nuclease of toxin-antitoxin system